MQEFHIAPKKRPAAPKAVQPAAGKKPAATPAAPVREALPVERQPRKPAILVDCSIPLREDLRAAKPAAKAAPLPERRRTTAQPAVERPPPPSLPSAPPRRQRPSSPARAALPRLSPPIWGPSSHGPSAAALPSRSPWCPARSFKRWRLAFRKEPVTHEPKQENQEKPDNRQRHRCVGGGLCPGPLVFRAIPVGPENRGGAAGELPLHLLLGGYHLFLRHGRQRLHPGDLPLYRADHLGHLRHRGRRPRTSP